MKTVSITVLRRNLSRILDEVEAGQVYVITRRGKPVAMLVPFEAASDG